MNALHALSRAFFFAILLGLLAAPSTLLAQNQTNDPLVDEQQYLFDVHRVGQAWNYTTGSSTVKIGIYSYTGFIQTHEDLSSSRLASPVGSLQDPKVDIASEMAGITGASTNNGVGMAGIDRAAVLQSYSVLTQSSTCVNDSRCSDEAETITFQRPDGTQETYYLNLYRFSDQISTGRSNGVDVHLVSFGLPSGDPADYSLDGPEAEDPFVDLSEPEKYEEPDQFDLLAPELRAAGERIKNKLCGGWFGDCLDPPDPATLLRDEIGFAVARDGGVVVSPAGNLNEDGDMPPRHLPGMFDPYAVTVGGVVGSEPDQLQAWDRTRPAAYVDVAAFAKNVVGTSGAGSKQYDTNFTSTAASASIGAGVSGLLRAEKPALTGEDIEEILKRTARDAGAPGEDDATGAGAIDAGAALAYVRNKDVQRSKQGVNEVVSDKVVGTGTELRGNGFWQYTSTNCQRPKGDLHKFRARVSYSQTFSETPDVWARWGASDGLLSSGREDGAYYDPLQKEIQVVDADARGFTVEGYYWVADFYNRYGQRCAENIRIPKSPEDFSFAYTAVGTEGTPPPAPAPPAPENFTLVNRGQSGEHPQLTWDSVDRAVSYQVFRMRNDPPYQKIATVQGVTNTSYTDTDITLAAYSSPTSESVNYYVKAVNEDGVASEPSDTDGGPIQESSENYAAQRLPALRDVEASSTGQRAALEWAARPNGLSAEHFGVQHRSDSTAAWTTVGRVPTADSVSTESPGEATYRFETDNPLDVGTHQFRFAFETKTGLERHSRIVTARIELSDAYRIRAFPNPAQGRATVALAVKEEQDVEVAVYDVLGRQVTTLYDGPLRSQETKRLSLDAPDSGLSSGTYFVRVQGEGFVATERLTVVQ